jgi:primary-amine oxidase
MIRIGILGVACLLQVFQFAGAEPLHPLDALEAHEITRAAAILRAAGHTDAATPMMSITLEVPSKTSVLGWQPGDPIPRHARAIIRSKRVNREFIVDLDANEVVDIQTIPGPGQPSVVLHEFIAAIMAVTSNPGMQAALAKRGLNDLEAAFCAPRASGNFGTPVELTRRIAKVDCFDISNNPDNIFAAPIEGLVATVDLDSAEVLDIVDLGVVPVTQTSYSLAPSAQKSIRDTHPVHVTAPKGSNIRIDGWMISWHNWRFHLRWDRRAGLIVSMVQYAHGDRLRSVLYQGNVSEIYVPYQDTTETWYYRNYMDEGDYGLGSSGSPLVAGADCPAQAMYLSPVMANAAGGADEQVNRICVFEQPTGDPTWRHYDGVVESLEARPNVQLVARFVATVGNYDYLIDWIFDNKGQLTYRLGASGIDAVKGVESKHISERTAARDTQFGPLIAPGLAGINHDHFFSLRLDVDIDGQSNRFVSDKLIPQRQPAGSQRRSIWSTERAVADTDSNAKFRLSYQHPSLWRVESSEQENTLGYPTSFMLKPSANALPLVDQDDPPLARAQFVNYHLWVTPHKDNELWAGGHYSNQSDPGKGLPEWTNQQRNIENTDIVLWYTLGFHHVPSAEDWPVYNLGWNSVTLKPYNFFDENPAMDLAVTDIEPQ